MTNSGSVARPDLAAYRDATSLGFSKVVEELAALLGKKLTAYIGGAKDTRAVDRWIAGTDAYRDAESRVRFAFRVAKTLGRHDHPNVVQAWFTGLNPELGDRSPIRVIREGDEDSWREVLGAARAFVAGG